MTSRPNAYDYYAAELQSSDFCWAGVVDVDGEYEVKVYTIATPYGAMVIETYEGEEESEVVTVGWAD